MADTIKRYQKDDLEVVWQPNKCTHSAVCAKSLGDVFNPKRRPWIDLDAGDADSIIETVKSCPSGALSLADLENENSESENSDSPVAQHSSVSGQVIANGPLLVKGEMLLTHADGTKETKKNPALCRCGASQNKPFCDGSHSKIEFKG